VLAVKTYLEQQSFWRRLFVQVNDKRLQLSFLRRLQKHPIFQLGMSFVYVMSRLLMFDVHIADIYPSIMIMLIKTETTTGSTSASLHKIALQPSLISSVLTWSATVRIVFCIVSWNIQWRGRVLPLVTWTRHDNDVGLRLNARASAIPGDILAFNENRPVTWMIISICGGS
jgi:hypothetical protein